MTKRATQAYDLRHSIQPPMPYAEIARRMETSVSNVGVLIHSARGRAVTYPYLTTLKLTVDMKTEIDAVMADLRIGRMEAIRTLIQWGLDSQVQA